MKISINKTAITVIIVLFVLFAGLTPALAGHVDYNYDNAGRLIQADFGSNKYLTYSYDNNGNLMARTTVSFTLNDGDVNHSGATDLTDTVLILKILAGLTPSGVY